MKLKLKRALTLGPRARRVVIDNALTGIALALFAAGVSAIGVWLGV